MVDKAEKFAASVLSLLFLLWCYFPRRIGGEILINGSLKYLTLIFHVMGFHGLPVWFSSRMQAMPFLCEKPPRRNSPSPSLAPYSYCPKKSENKHSQILVTIHGNSFPQAHANCFPIIHLLPGVMRYTVLSWTYQQTDSLMVSVVFHYQSPHVCFGSSTIHQLTTWTKQCNRTVPQCVWNEERD